MSHYTSTIKGKSKVHRIKYLFLETTPRHREMSPSLVSDTQNKPPPFLSLSPHSSFFPSLPFFSVKHFILPFCVSVLFSVLLVLKLLHFPPLMCVYFVRYFISRIISLSFPCPFSLFVLSFIPFSSSFPLSFVMLFLSLYFIFFSSPHPFSAGFSF
uniref:Transmembrane protein n=1 Tax=Cacopsylla melanoneura TaxID=428564 RepID=A0A8D8QDK7_9HEMI